MILTLLCIVGFYELDHISELPQKKIKKILKVSNRMPLKLMYKE
ncbi:hypothetical protein C942_01695 [Photobacterium marinum]|uniref:Uncharacterized protein n=1 Tax=Photobacterium marinum TaxID=1056511 RepID=L8JA70_9GAMM|nr:hypothetical protein C942_01695 [Photobacterium marinum]